MICKICGREFEPIVNQKKAAWAVNWCSYDTGLLCPPCHIAAESLGAMAAIDENGHVFMGIAPFKSDIAAKIKHITKNEWAKMRSNESFYKWAEEQHPEWV